MARGSERTGMRVIRFQSVALETPPQHPCGATWKANDLLAVLAGLDQACGRQHAKMPRHRRPRQFELLGHYPRRQVVIAKQLQDLPPRRIGQGLLARQRLDGAAEGSKDDEQAHCQHQGGGEDREHRDETAGGHDPAPEGQVDEPVAEPYKHQPGGG